MDIQKLNGCMQMMKADLGSGLLAADIFTTDEGQSVVGYKTVEEASALFSQITEYISSALKSSGFPVLGKYYLMDLAENKMAVLIPLGDYQFGMLVDKSSVKLGLLMSLSIPKLINAFEDALVSEE